MMAADTNSAKAEKLVSLAQQHLDNNDRAGSIQAAHEALQLQPHNKTALGILHKLQDSQSDASVTKLSDSFTSGWNVDVGKQLRELLQGRASTLDDDQATECLTLLLDRRWPDSKIKLLVGDCVRLLLFHSKAGKRALVQRLIADVTQTFEKIWDLSEGAITKLFGVIIDSDTSLWQSKAQWYQAIRGVFQLCLSKLIDAGQDYTEWAINGVVLLSGTAPEQLKDLVDFDCFSIILECMDIRAPEPMRRASLVGIKLLLDATGEDGQKHLKNYVTTRVARGTNEDLILAFSAASFTFPIIPGPASQLFLTEGFLQNLVPKLQQNSNNPGDRKSNKLEQSALELISAACRDDACQKAVIKHCLPWLQDVAESSTNSECSALAAVILAKTYKIDADAPVQSTVRDIGHLAFTLTNIMLNAEDDSEVRTAIEGLSYLALEPKVKESISTNERLLQKVISILQNQQVDGLKDAGLFFGALVTIHNVTQYRPKQTEEQKRVEQLKAYAAASRPQARDDPLDDDKHVETRCRRIAETEIVPAMLSRVKGMNAGNMGWTSRVLLALSQDKRNRARLVQQGAIKYLLQIYEYLKSQPQDDEKDQTILRAAHTLARLLISVNPNHVFTPAVPAIATIRPLTDLLNVNDSLVELLATFEALLALTNIASMEDASARETLIQRYFDPVEHLLLYDHIQLQRAATELICNLMASPSAVALFADGSPQAKRRMHLLLALTDVDDFPTRSAAGGGLAMATEYEAGCKAVLERSNGVKLVLGLCDEEGEGSEQLMHRGLVVLVALVSAPNPTGQTAVEKVKTEGGTDIIKNALKRTRNQTLLGIGVDVLKKLA